jgi:hypothetical protein
LIHIDPRNSFFHIKDDICLAGDLCWCEERERESWGGREAWPLEAGPQQGGKEAWPLEAGPQQEREVWWPLEAGPQQGREAGPAEFEPPERNCSLLDLNKKFFTTKKPVEFFSFYQTFTGSCALDIL